MSANEATDLPAKTPDTEDSSVDGIDEDELKLVITRWKTCWDELCRNGSC